MQDRAADPFETLGTILRGVVGPEVRAAWEEQDAWLDEHHPGTREQFLAVIAAALVPIAREEKDNRIPHWVEVIYRSRQFSWSWNSDPGHQYASLKTALNDLCEVADLVQRLKEKLDGLPLNVRLALGSAEKKNRAESIAIADDTRSDRSTFERFCRKRETHNLVTALKLGAFEDALRDPDIVAYVRRIPQSYEMSSLLHSFGLGVENAKRHIHEHPAGGGRPRKERERFLRQIAAKVYEDLSGLPADATLNHRPFPGQTQAEVMPFKTFIDRLWPRLGIPKSGSRGMGGISQARKLRKERVNSKRMRT